MANVYPVLYRLGVTPWEANRDDGPLAEVLATRPPGRALDAGCGTGRHAVSIAEHGWTVTGVDGVGQALRKASARAETAGVGDRATFVQGDVAHLDSVLGEERYDLVLDIGCFHGLTDPDRIAFAGWVTRHTADGAVLLLHAVLPRSGVGPRGIDDAGVRAAFGPAWSLSSTESTTAGGGPLRGAVFRWCVLRRRADGSGRG